MYNTSYSQGLDKDSPEVMAASELLRGLPLNLEVAREPKYRSPSSVMRRLLNYAHLDGKSGLSGGGEPCRIFWEEFNGKPELVAQLAAEIRVVAPLVSSAETEEEATATEGAMLARLHVRYERNQSFAKRKKASVLQKTGKLACEACGFDFLKAYGSRGEGYIECHHLIPLSSLKRSTTTRLRDLALICSNCHRMVHRKPWISVQELVDEIGRTGRSPGNNAPVPRGT
ncbi:MAG TPA: HNH endonuclease [Candidatus Thermoplasmatota archaeon]|nr:HNH endonuclease [Candidatus Thermoplasmatota archaeon]